MTDKEVVTVSKLKTKNLVSVGSLVISVLAVAIGIFQFNCNQKNLKTLELTKLYQSDSLQIEQQHMDLKIQSYKNTANAIGGILSSDTTQAAYKNAIHNFNHIYYGESILFTDDNIGKLLQEFKYYVQDYQRGYLSKTKLNEIGVSVCDSLKHYLWIRNSVYK